MNTRPENWEKLRDPAYRHALATSQFKRFVPFQISALRKQKPWSQQQLADSAGLTQGVISRAEDPDNGNLTVNTILRIANGLDRVFVGLFMSYAEFEQWRRKLSEDTVVLDFEQEDARFKRDAVSAPEENAAKKYLEALLVGSMTSGKAKTVLEVVPTPANQKWQLCLPLPPPYGLRIVGGTTRASEMQNAPAEDAKLAMAGGIQ